jgi:hypothetical protein
MWAILLLFDAAACAWQLCCVAVGKRLTAA